jgi:alkylation response protein AidB-like acyl-CoA dehydrogenase
MGTITDPAMDLSPDRLAARPAPTDLLAARPALADSLAAARDLVRFGVDPAATLAWMRSLGDTVPLPGDDTAARWDVLAETARGDVGAARMLEPHLDAMAILAEARRDGRATGIDLDPRELWGVFAAEGGDRPLRADPAPDGTWRLTGTKPWCSLAARLDRALVTAWTGDERGLFAVDLRGDGVRPHPGPWPARGLAQVVSAPVDFDAASARPVGEPGWYLRRPGFEAGGMGVAAVWWGAALPIVDALAARAVRDGADQLSAVYAGQADAASWSASTVLRAAAAEVDRAPDGAGMKLLAARVRAVVAREVRAILALEARALGPGPVATDEDHARRVADLDLYLRQDHADRDLARLHRLTRAARTQGPR